MHDDDDRRRRRWLEEARNIEYAEQEHRHSLQLSVVVRLLKSNYYIIIIIGTWLRKRVRRQAMK